MGRPPPWRMKLQCLVLVAASLLGVSSASCTRLPPCESVLASLHLPACTRGCSTCGLVLCLPRRCSLRLLLFCTCLPLLAGALWLIPAWVWRDALFFSFSKSYMDMASKLFTFTFTTGCTRATTSMNGARRPRSCVITSRIHVAGTFSFPARTSSCF